MSAHTRELLRKVAAGKHVSGTQIASLFRDGYVTVHLTEKGKNLINTTQQEIHHDHLAF